MKKALLFIFILFTIYVNAQEGTKQFMPNSTDRLWMEIYRTSSKYFATYSASDKERLYIYLDAGETAYFGMKMASYQSGNARRTTFRIKDPSGNVVYAESEFPSSGDNGYIDTYDEATTGPNGAILNGTTISGGYDALTYTAATSGNHYIEFEMWRFNIGNPGNYTYPSRRSAIEFFDVTVTDASDNIITNPGEPNVSAGRLWSKGWAFTTTSYTNYPVKTQFYVFTADEFVNKVKYEMKPYSFNFVSNSYGVDTDPTLNVIEQAQSQDGDLTNSSDISEYRIFLNDPDRGVWPNTTLPPPTVKVWAEGTLIYDYDYNRDPQVLSLSLDTIDLEKNSVVCPYSSITLFKIETNISGFTTILLDIDGGGYSTDGNDRALDLDLKKGVNYILWDFKDDNGNIVVNGNISSSATFLGRGPAHFPLYDVESLSGIETSSIRPFNKLGPTLYWDDTQIGNWGDLTGSGSMDETDTAQLTIENHISRVWIYDDSNTDYNGNFTTMNSWFNAIDLGLPDLNFKVVTSLTKCVNGEAPYVGDIYIQGDLNTDINFVESDFTEKYYDALDNDMDSIAILTLPSNGTLKLSSVDVSINDSIASTDIANLTFTPETDWGGIAEFVWEATNGIYWSNNQDTVFLIINTDPTISDISDTTICTNTNLTDVLFTVGDAESDPADLNIIAYSHDPSVVSNSDISIGGSGANRTITINPPANTSGYTIIYVKVDDGLTEVIDEFALYIGPSISFTGDTTVCDGDPLELSAVEFGADTYTWQFAGSTIRTTQDLTIDPFTTDSVGAYTLTVSADGCAASQVINVSIAPIVTFTGDTLVCTGEEISLSADETVAAYSWKKGVTEISTTKVLTIASADAGDIGTDYTLEVTKEGCNNTSDPFGISVIAQPTTNLTITGSTVNRDNDGTVTIGTSQSGITYNAYISGALVATETGDGNDLVIIIPAAELSVGNNTIDIKAENANCEIDMDNQATIVVIVVFTIDPIADANVNENTIYTSVTPNLSGDTPVGTITYTLGGVDAADFTINASTGVVSMIARDFENPVDDNTDNVYELTITATDDDGNNDSEDWIVTVDDAVEIVNFTIDAIGDATVNENSAYTSITPSLSGDTPIGNITYTLGGADAVDFSINASTGDVSMIARNYENPDDDNIDNVYELSITATDDDGNNDVENWTVTVLDVIELATFTIDAIADVNVNENSAYTSVAPSITGSPIGNVTYTLGGNDAADFTINASTGVVDMIARNYESPVDNNTDNIYELTITATDDDGNNDTESWTVTIDDVAEVANFTINAIGDVSINENSAYTSVTPNLSGDTPIGNVTYTLSGADAADFTIDPSTGIVNMVTRDFENPVDANIDNVYELTITVTDDDGNNDSENWTVTVLDVIEIASFTIDAIVDVNVNENSVYTSVTPSITGSPIGNVVYTLGGTDAADFSINATTGVVGMIARDYESPDDADTDNVYELTITATDDDGNNDSESWTVTVDDFAEIANFTIDAISDANVNENSGYTSVTPSLSGDAPVGNVTYTIGGVDAADFSINASTGVVTMVARDFETPVDADLNNDYELTITVTDDDGNFDSEDWIVSVQDLLETASFTIDPINDATVNENSAYTSVTPSITGSPIGSITYTIEGADAGDFSINATNGVVTMVARNYENPVDANTDNIYELTIIATDDDGNNDSEDWTVSVQDLVEAAVFTIDAIADINIDENIIYTSVTPNLSGDAPIGNVTYTIGGTDATDFTINASTGVVSMIARDFENPVDANNNNVYELTITATDEDGNEANENWTVTVDNVVEVANFIINAIGDVSINENSAYTGVTPSLSGDVPIGNVTYTLGGADAGDFSINATTGEVSMVARNYETPVDANTDNVYELTITATDEDGNSDDEDWTVTILNVVEVAAFTIDVIANTNVDENTVYTSVIPNLSGDTPIGNVTYTLGGTDASDFTINASTGVVSMFTRDFENPVDANTNNIYELSITATDDDGNFDSEDWTVTVDDVVEVANFTIDAIADANVNENSAYTSVLPNLSGDAPIGNVTYTISGSDAADFSINASTGVVTMVARDFETPEDADLNNDYELTITVTDDDGNFDSEDWIVTVQDIIEIVSFTINEIIDVAINENSSYASVTPSISGSPIGNLTYTLGGIDASDFTINASTGVVSMIARDFENPVDDNTDNVYELTITATDDDGNFDTESWTVTVLDIVEVVSFTIDPIADANVDENTAYISSTPNLSGDTPIGNVVYAISGSDASDFTIDPNTGIVSMVARDYESPDDDDLNNVYELIITAMDDDGNSDSEDWTVTVVDIIEVASFTIDEIIDVTVNENSAYVTIAPTISGSPIGSLTYTLGGTDAADFTINSVTGVVSMVARDFENPADANTDNVYELTITATDDDGNFDTEDWTVTVLDLVETVTFTIDPIVDATVDENNAYTSVTPNLSGDTPIGNVTYTISGTDASDFTIDPNTGVVNMVVRDYESPDDDDLNNVYELIITATDDDGNSDSEDWTVTVQDLVEPVTFTIDPIADAIVDENSPYTSVTPTITGSPVGSLTYTLGGADAADFTINAIDGVVSMVARDYENPVDANLDNVYELVIFATDDDGNSDIEDWTVTVQDLIELTSFTINAINDTTVVEGTIYTSVTPTITGSPIGNLTYTLSGIDAADFTIDAITGVVSMVARDYENPVDDNLDNVYEVTITATDDDGNSDTEDWIVTVKVDTDGDGIPDDIDTDDDNDGNPDVTDPNPLVPTAVNDVMTVTEGESAAINVLANDDFLPGANIELADLGTGTAVGTVSFDPLTGEMTYTPLAGEEGNIVTVDYQVWNTAVTPEVFDDATVTITVIPANHLPVAVNDLDSTDEDTDVNIDVLSNDTGLDDGGLVITITDNPDYGTINIELDNTITYSPDPDYYGTDSLMYEVCDVDGECSTATVKITINAVSDYTPVANDDSRGTSVNTDVIVDVLFNDTGLGDGGLVLTVVSGPNNGSVVINGDNTITYTPDTDNTGTDNFDYQICDIDAECSIATVTITVKENNNDPVAVDDNATTLMNIAVTIDVLSNDTGLEDGIQGVTINSGATNGSLVVNADNTITYTPNSGYTGADSFEYLVSDVDGDYSIAMVSITVNTIPDYMPVANDDSRGTSINTDVIVDVLINDTGLEDGGLVLTVVSGPSNGSVVVNGNNTITYSPDTDYTGTDNFNYQVCDGDSDCSSATVTITVKENNNEPLAVDDNATTIMNTAVTIDVLSNDTGLEDGIQDVTEYSGASHGNIVINADNSITYTPNSWYTGSDSFEYMVRDINGDYSVATVTITINTIPDYIPVANDDARGTSINTDVIVDVLANDTGLEDGGLVLTIISGPSDGSVIINGDNTITYSPDTDYTGTDNFDYQVCDGDGDCSSATVTITVKANNNVPLAVDDNATTIMNTDVSVDVLSNDSGLDDGGISVTIISDPSHGNVIVNGDNSVTYTPNNWYVGSDTFEYMVSDVDGDNSIAIVNITVDPKPNYEPVANDDARGTSINTDVIVDVLSNDTGLEDGGLVLTIVNNPSNGTVNINGDNTITYSPDNDYLGTDNFDYEVCDVDGDCSTATVTITVKENNYEPVAVDDKVFTNIDTDVTIEVLGNDSGLEDGGILVIIDSDVSNGSVIVNADNTITYSPGSGFEGTDNFSYKVMDVDGDYAIADVEVIVMSGTLPSITVSAISGNTAENGTTANFTIVLGTQPIDDVNIDLNTDNPSEGVVSNTILTFTTTNWDTPQTVIVTGQDDYIDDGDINYHILIDNAVSSDPIYNGLTIDNIDVINTDDDEAGITVIPGTNETGEDGTSTSFKLVLNSQPLADVSIDLVSDNVLEGSLEILNVLFTSENWTDTISLVVTGQDDNEVDGDITYNIIISPAVSTDTKYDGLDPDDISLINIDDDSKELIIPEAFSPGDDGFNDYFHIVNLEHYEKASIRIYNRWGSLVYSKDNYKNDWDGRSNAGGTIGSELPTGTYYYVLEIKDNGEKKNGYVFIKR